MSLLPQEFRDFIYGELQGMILGLNIVLFSILQVLQLYVENKKVEMYKEASKYPKEQREVIVNFYDEIFAGNIAYKDAKYVLEKIKSAREMAFDAQIAIRKDSRKALDIIINANGELDRANQKLKAAPKLQKYLDPTRATILNIRKQLAGYLKKQKAI